MLCTLVLVEAAMQAMLRGWVGSPDMRARLLVAGAFWNDLMTGTAHPAFAAQPVTMFVSHGFLHFGLLHLAANIVPLAVFGTAALWRVGTARFLALWFATMVAAAALYGLADEAGSAMVGASGVVYGLAGAVTVWLWQDRPGRRWRAAAPLLILALAIAVNGALWVWLAGNFAWQLHLAGFAVGAALAPWIGRAAPDAARDPG
jgi:membrane associated rhomboid family serine protease